MSKERKKKMFPGNMKRLSKPMPFTQETIDRILKGSHGIYVLRNENGATQYVGIG